MATLASIIKNALDLLNSYDLSLEPSIDEALKLSREAVMHTTDVPIVGIRGPPGTGKTKIMEGLTYDRDVIGELLDGSIKFLYIAPTNELTTSGFVRALTPILKRLQEKGLSVEEALSKVRICGSSVPRPYLISREIDELKSRANVDKDLLNKIACGKIDDATFIFTTDYQRVSARATASSYRFVMFVDEASKAPFYLPFTPVSDSELKNLANDLRNYKSGKVSGGIIHGLIVVGDERQAIALNPEYQGFGKKLLVLPKIKEVLEALGYADSQFMTLTTTFRLPSPTQEPIGRGFYSDVGGLKAYYDSRTRMVQALKDIGDLEERLNKCRDAYDDSLWRLTVETILETALTDLNKPKPIIIVNTCRYIPAGSRFEPLRVKLATYFALALSCISHQRIGISVIAPYIDLVDNARYYYNKLYNKLAGKVIEGHRDRVRFSTVQSMLGGEDDIVISMLGKEWSKSSDPTIYFREPENLNVQFSRHRMMFIVIGNLIKLRNSAANVGRKEASYGYIMENFDRIRQTADALFELAGVYPPPQKCAEASNSTGDYAIFHKIYNR